MKKYSTVQIEKETHILLQEYCKEHGYKISGLVESLIKQRCIPTRNVLSVSKT